MAHSRASKTEATTFCLYFHYISIFSIEQLRSYHENSWNSANRLNYPSHPTPPHCQQQQAAAHIVWRWHFMSFAIFYKCFRAMSNFFQFITYGHTIGKAETQPTDQVLPPVLQHCLAKINGQGWVYFCGEFFSPLHFFKIIIAMLHNIFHLNSTIPTREWPKLSTQNEFGLLPCTTTLPTSMGSSVFILKVRFNFLYHFRSCLFHKIW